MTIHLDRRLSSALAAAVAQVRAYPPAHIALMIVFPWSRWMNGEKGTRSDVPHHMIYPLKDTRPNLHFVTGVHVKRVTFDECV